MWKLAGKIDHDFSRYFEPEHRVVQLVGKRWLVLRAQDNSGSGVSSASQRWFEASGGAIQEVLQLPSDGSQSGNDNDPVRAYSVQVTGYSSNANRESLQVRFVVRFRLPGENTGASLGSRIIDSIYQRAPGCKVFVFKRSDSQISRDELLKAFGIDTFTREDFLRFNFENLQRILQGRPSPARTWLLRVLPLYQPTTERNRLLASVHRLADAP